MRIIEFQEKYCYALCPNLPRPFTIKYSREGLGYLIFWLAGLKIVLEGFKGCGGGGQRFSLQL